MAAPNVTMLRAEQSADSHEDADSTSDISGGLVGDGAERADVRLFLDSVFGSDTGIVVFALGINPRRNPNSGKYEHGSWSERNGEKIVFGWPEEAEQICDAIDQYAHRGDLYVVPYLRRSRARRKGDAVILRLVHTDGDKGLDQEKIDRLADLGAFVIGSGSPGNGHVYVPLNEEVSQVAHIALCRGLIEYLDGDKAKHSDNDLLRPVGGYNFKSTVFEGLPARQVQWLIKPNGTRVDPHTLAALLGVDLAAAEERAKTNGRANKEKARITGTARVISQHHAEDPKPIDLERYPKVGEALAEVSEPPDRSRDLHRVVRAVYDANLTEAHAVWAVQQRDDLADRLSEHPDDVARSWSKIDVEQRLAHTDKGNATQLVAEYSPGIRYVPEIGKWMHWNGVLWHFDPDTGTIDTAAGQIATELPGATKRDRSHRKRSLSAAGIGAMVRLARSDPAMRCSRDRLDASGWQLNTLSGIVNLRTGEICDHHPDAWHTKITGVGYDPEGDCPRWTEFLRTTFEGDEELIAYVQGLCGYAAIGKVLANILPFFWGAGQNGKTVLLEVISRVLGDYAIAAPANFLLAGRDKHETEIARLAGARFVVCSEINQGTRFDEAKVKVLTGGDTLTGRFMHGNFFDFSPSHMLILVGNHQPAVGAGGYAFWRRVRLVPFTHQVPEDKRNKHLADELVAAEGPAILGWIARGAATVASDELVTPERVMTATEEYEESEDRTKQFLDDCTTRGTGEDRELVGDVYQRYIEWCHANRFKDPLESRVFAREIYSRGYQKAKSNGKRYIHGLKLTRQTWDRQQQ